MWSAFQLSTLKEVEEDQVYAFNSLQTYYYTSSLRGKLKVLNVL